MRSRRASVSGYLRDVALRKQLEDKVKEASKTRQQAEAELAVAQQVIDGAKAIDADTSRAVGPLAEAMAAMAGKDYRAALEKAAEAKERAHLAYRDRTRAILASGHSQLEIARSLGSDMSEGQALLKKADEAYAAEDYPAAIDAARKAWKKTEKTLYEHQSAQFSKAQALILAAKALGRDVSAANDLLSRARNAVESNDYESALAYNRECIEAVTGDLRSEYQKVAEEAAALAQTIREIGGDAARAESLLERARADAEKLDYEKAFSAVKQSRSESERFLDRSLEGLPAEFARQAERAERIGAETGRARSEFAEAERAARAGRRAEGAALGRRAFESLAQAQLDRIVGRIAQSRDKIVVARQIGADIEPVLNLLKMARQASQSGVFEDGLSYANQADAELDRIIGAHRSVEERVKAMYGAFADAEALGVSTGNARRELDRARVLLQDRQMERVDEALGSAREELDRAVWDRTTLMIGQVESILALVERANGDVRASRATLRAAAAAAESREHARAIELAGTARRQAEEALAGRLADSIADVKGVSDALGDAPNVRNLIAKTESARAAKDFASALAFLEEARKLAAATTRDRAGTFHAALRLTVELGRDLGATVGGLEAILKQVDGLVEGGRFADALHLERQAATDIANASAAVFNLLKDKLVEARGLKIDIEPMRELLKQGKLALGGGDYPEGYRLMKEANDLVNRPMSTYRNAHTALQGATAMVAEAKKRGVDVAKLVEMLVEGKKAFERMEFDHALDVGNRAKAETEKLMVLYASAQRVINGRERFELATQLGIDAPHLRERLNEAKEAMKTKDYDTALRLSDGLDVELVHAIRDKVATMIEAAEVTIHEMKVGVVPQRDALVRAQELLDRGEFAAAADLVRRTRDDLGRLREGVDALGSTVTRAREAIAELEAMGIKVEPARKSLETAEAALRTGRVDEARQLAAKARADLDAETERSVMQAMKRFEESIARARQAGADIRSAEGLFERARVFLSARQYRQALALAAESESEAARVSLQHEMATSAIENVEKKLAAVKMPVPIVRSMIDDARRALQEKDLVRALDLAIRASDGFSVARDLVEGAIGARTKAEKMHEVAGRIGADAAGSEAALKDGVAALEAGNAEGARTAFARAFEAAAGACRARLAALLDHATQSAEFAAHQGVDPATVLRKVSEAKTQLEAGNYDSAYLVVEEARKSAQKFIGEKISERLSEAEATVLHAKRMGADAGEAEEALRRASAALVDADFERALHLIDESQAKVESRRLIEKRFVDLTYKAESTIRRARKFGIDVRAAEQALSLAIGAKKADIARATTYAEESYRVGWEAVEAFAPKIEALLEAPEAKVNTWSSATLVLTNTGRALAKDVRVRILGDVEVDGLRDVAAIRARGTETVPLKIRFGNPGTIPVAIQVTSKRVFDDKEYQQDGVAQVVVGSTAREEIRRELRAETESRCPVCKGLIKPGHPIARCTCNRDFHEMCAARVGTCPVCFKPLARPVPAR